MCHLFASQSPDSYAFETRSIRLNGQSTSLRLERVFWDILEDIAAAESDDRAAFHLDAAPGDPAPARGSAEFHLAPALHLRQRSNFQRARRTSARGGRLKLDRRRSKPITPARFRLR